MPVNWLAASLSYASTNKLVYGAVAFFALYAFKAWAGGRRNTCERDWTGKMILIVAPPTPTIISLIHHLLHLPKPPQILFLPPLPSPLPEELLTILHAIRLSAEKNPLAQLHCEPLPRTPEAVADFTMKWGTGLKGTISENGRRVDAIILGEGWEVVAEPLINAVSGDEGVPNKDKAGDKKNKKSKATTPTKIAADDDHKKNWTILQFQFHLLTSLLPFLLRAPAERSIRIVTLISPGWSAALPTLQSKPLKDAPLTISGQRGLASLLIMRQFQIILDTLAKSNYGKEVDVPVPDPHGNLAMPGDGNKKKEVEGIKSNILGVSVIMPWTRDEVIRGAMGGDASVLGAIYYILFYPILIFLTPSPSRAIHSILFALSAPIRYTPSSGERKKPKSSAGEEPVEAGISGGDVVRNCQVIELPPVLLDPLLARTNYEALEKEVESRIKESKKGK